MGHSENYFENCINTFFQDTLYQPTELRKKKNHHS
jgi:hypothetical protein